MVAVFCGLFLSVGVMMLGLFIVLVLRPLRVRIRWTRIGGRLRLKSIIVAWSGRRRRR
jgi:hypothetical protein